MQIKIQRHNTNSSVTPKTKTKKVGSVLFSAFSSSLCLYWPSLTFNKRGKDLDLKLHMGYIKNASFPHKWAN